MQNILQMSPTNVSDRARHKPKIDILLVKSSQFDEIIAAEGHPEPHNTLGQSSSAGAAAATADESTSEQDVDDEGSNPPSDAVDASIAATAVAAPE